MSRTTVSPFLRGATYWARVPRIGLMSVQRSLGTGDLAKAREICGFLQAMRTRRESYLLDQLTKPKSPITVGEAFDAFIENRLEEFISDLREGRRDEDLEPHVAKWLREMERVRKPNAETRANYVRQVRTLIEEGKPFPRSRFTKPVLKEWLGGLSVTATNRYRAAASKFASYLVSEEILASNPVMKVEASKEAEPRTRHLDQREAKAVIDALTGAHRAYHALSAATGLERQALERLRRSDIDLAAKTVFARATKKAHRTRTVTVYWRWEWAWEIVVAYLKANPMLPDARVFPQISKDGAIRALRTACTAVQIEDYRPHDWRHTWAVQGIRDGLAIMTIAHQLGHRDAVMTLRVYGRYQPVATDFQSRNATNTATTQNEATR